MNSLAVVLLVFCWICMCPLAVDITDIDDYDPGTCDKSNLLQVYSIKDRNDKKKLWVCNKENGTYVWNPVDGNSNVVGEFLSPGTHCSNILDEEVDAEDGFYWLTLGTKTKRRVWCDMTTDGGGYMLVARKHAIAWDIPSKDETVDPQSSQFFWTSQLGNARILDFRVQLSTSKTFTGTKAHWSYRLKNTRQLGELMIDDRGCDSNSPGIGDIAYVKDLMTGKIVTTKFRCSVFGLGHTSPLGWKKINQCLKKPCRGSGYYDHLGFPINLDHTGIFSYSVANVTSGYKHYATASIGCDQDVCCGCFGPVGGKLNYCAPKCKTINGGHFIDRDKIFTWIWVRTKLPKRIWNKCMEYQSEDVNGKLQWYSISGDSGIAEKGRCPGLGKLLLNSGVVVVPDNETAKEVPAIPGLLEYRKDQRKLYVRTNETWKSLTQDKKIEQLTKKLAFLLPQFSKYDEITNVMNKHPECTSYQWLNESNRNENYYSSYERCDSSLSNTWYRFGGKAGTRMSSICPGPYRCSAYRTAYLYGDHPGLHEGIVTRTVYVGNGDYHCHQWSVSIKVLNCGLYYVYKFGSISWLGCYYRYCGSF